MKLATNQQSKQRIFINLITITLGLSLLSYVFPAPILADTNPNCQPIFGGGATCVQANNLSIDKKILNPQTGALVDNLNADTYEFVPGQIISFQIALKNTSGNTLSNITLKDIFPNKYLNFYSGPGKFDTNTKTMNLSIDSLNKDETKTYTIRATIADQQQFTDNQTICLSNQAQAIQGNQTSEDTTQFCVTATRQLTDSGASSNNTTTKGGLPIYPSQKARRTPSTGPEEFAVFGLIPTGALGWLLRKKTKLTN
jgi:uncharacterized repeat protein (TIGR01451 family)